MAQKVISTAILIAIMCHFSEQNPVPEQNRLMNETYTECNSMISTCVGMPKDCIAKQMCTVLLSAKPTQTGADFMLHWNRDSTSLNKWVAAGLSTDRKMGDDSVTECILSNHTMVKVRQGLTHCNKTDCGVDTVEPVKGITKEMGTYGDDNVLTCSWSRTVDTMVRNLDFNIQKNKYYILLAYGPILNGELAPHTDKLVSKDAFLLGQPEATTTPTNSTTVTPTTAQPKSTRMPMSTSGNATMTTTTSNTTSTAGNTTSSHTNPHKMSTTAKPKNGSKTITFGLSLGIFATIVLSLNL